MPKKTEPFEYYNSEQIGEGLPVLNIIVGVHGDELAPLLAVDILKKKINKIKLKKSFRIIYANSMALKQKRRFIERDLNTSFLGKINGVYEERLACKLISEINDCDFNFDFHTTNFPVSPYSLISEYNKKTERVLRAIGIGNCLFTDRDSTVKHLDNCIGFEFGERNSKKTVLLLAETMKDILIYCGVVDGKLNKTGKKVNIFLIYSMIKKGGNVVLRKLKDFSLVKKGDRIGRMADNKVIYAKENFYPVWSNNPSFVNKAKNIIIKI